MLEGFIADVLKYKASLKAKLKCMSVTMCSLVMAPFSWDSIKTKIDVLTYLHECSTHIAPGFTLKPAYSF